MKSITEPTKELEVSHEADVVISGGGTAGIAAAVCAARMGLKTVMIERSSIPGGMVTHVTMWLNDFKNKGGFASEFEKHLVDHKIAEWPYYNRYQVIPYFDNLLEDAGAIPLYLAQACTPVVEDGSVKAVIMESKQGRTAITCKAVIDCTGDGDIASRAGADFKMGRDEDGACQAVSLSCLYPGFTKTKVHIKDELLPEIHKADKRLGRDPYDMPYTNGYVHSLVGSEGVLTLGIPHICGYNPLKADELSTILIELRKQSVEFCDRINSTGKFGKLSLAHMSDIPGIRETRRIECDYMLELADLEEGRKFDDGIFTVTQNIDIHKCNEGEPCIYGQHIVPYNVPFRSLIPKKLNNVLVAGRCIGGSHEALASYRIIADCFAMGEAAAIAVKESVDKNIRIRETSAAVVQEMKKRNYEI